LVSHGERVTIHAIAGAKVALEVRGPEIIGMDSRDRDNAGMLIVTTPAAFLDQPLARQEVARRADRREINRRMTRAEPVQELVWPPAGSADGLQISVATARYFVTPPRGPAAIAEPFAPA
jgi:hypothetical protein